jgi:hypothetical protein
MFAKCTDDGLCPPWQRSDIDQTSKEVLRLESLWVGNLPSGRQRKASNNSSHMHGPISPGEETPLLMSLTIIMIYIGILHQ